MKLKFSATKKAVKISDAKNELKMEYQLLVDVVDKGLQTREGSFAALTAEKF